MNYNSQINSLLQFYPSIYIMLKQQAKSLNLIPDSRISQGDCKSEAFSEQNSFINSKNFDDDDDGTASIYSQEHDDIQHLHRQIDSKSTSRGRSVGHVPNNSNQEETASQFKRKLSLIMKKKKDLGLISNTKADKFDNRLRTFRMLDTFINVKHQIQKVASLNDLPDREFDKKRNRKSSLSILSPKSERSVDSFDRSSTLQKLFGVQKKPFPVQLVIQESEGQYEESPVKIPQKKRKEIGINQSQTDTPNNTGSTEFEISPDKIEEDSANQTLNQSSDAQRLALRGRYQEALAQLEGSNKKQMDAFEDVYNPAKFYNDLGSYLEKVGDLGVTEMKTINVEIDKKLLNSIENTLKGGFTTSHKEITEQDKIISKLEAYRVRSQRILDLVSHSSKQIFAKKHKTHRASGVLSSNFRKSTEKINGQNEDAENHQDQIKERQPFFDGHSEIKKRFSFCGGEESDLLKKTLSPMSSAIKLFPVDSNASSLLSSPQAKLNSSSSKITLPAIKQANSSNTLDLNQKVLLNRKIARESKRASSMTSLDMTKTERSNGWAIKKEKNSPQNDELNKKFTKFQKDSLRLKNQFRRSLQNIDTRLDELQNYYKGQQREHFIHQNEVPDSLVEPAKAYPQELLNKRKNFSKQLTRKVLSTVF